MKKRVRFIEKIDALFREFGNTMAMRPYGAYLLDRRDEFPVANHIPQYVSIITQPLWGDDACAPGITVE